MLITQVKIDSSLQLGEFVQWDTQALQFVRCTDHMNMLGVVDVPPAQNSEGVWLATIRQAGVATALAGQDIPADGGALGIDENGRAIISTDHSCGLIQAQPYGQPARVAGDMVVIWLR